MSQNESRKQPSWEVVHDGPSLPMIQSPSGRIFRIQELGARGKQWDNPLDDETLCAMFAERLSATQSERPADTPNPLGLNEDSAQYSGQSIQSATPARYCRRYPCVPGSAKWVACKCHNPKLTKRKLPSTRRNAK